MELIVVNRNGAQNRMEMAKELKKHPAFKWCSTYDVIKSIRSYEKTGDFFISELFITIKHYC